MPTLREQGCWRQERPVAAHRLIYAKRYQAVFGNFRARACGFNTPHVNKGQLRMFCQVSDMMCMARMEPERSCNQTAANGTRRKVLVSSQEANGDLLKGFVASLKGKAPIIYK